MKQSPRLSPGLVSALDHCQNTCQKGVHLQAMWNS